ncbi:glycogen synthase [Paradesertivirga mongoliensis]|uniref:Glycogen synthase n=1 Tax=Paradesertivirga mongoliensis TaxID=2100740 RepID=A0ABW4ZJ93_9SPHI|nr:glycogen/starch synthase [Pedobacter mongoliensis]
MNVIHLSAECYPVAKVGGLGDVVGALPKYQQAAGISAMVVMPFYDRKFVKENEFEVIYDSTIVMGTFMGSFQVLREATDKLGFPLHLIKIPGLLDRPEIYSYPDESEQFVAFQIAFLEWLLNFEVLPDVIHSHDHHSGLIPFLLYHSSRYKSLSHIATVLTIHNGQYQGWLGWEKLNLLPDIDVWEGKLLEWGDCINPLASAVKCCWKYTTVSPSYLEELSVNSNGLEQLFISEKAKGVGIINGIDTDVWNPSIDPMISANYNTETATAGKAANKALVCKEFFLSDDKPLVAFIGRLVGEKGADLLPEAVTRILLKHPDEVNILILGSGEKEIEEELAALTSTFKENYNVFIGYHEALSHRIYAGADFLIMPSRVEPCGLNQLYSLRYGTVPIVRSTGGLKDTVIDVSEENGYGIRFEEANVDSIVDSVSRAVEIYKNSTQMELLRNRMMNLNYSWHQSAAQYITLYNNLKSL